MTTVGNRASRAHRPICSMVKGATWKRPLRKGTNSTAASSTIPAQKAAKLALLLKKPRAKMDCCPRQLKPWNSRARVRVAKASVMARALPPLFRPIK